MNKLLILDNTTQLVLLIIGAIVVLLFLCFSVALARSKTKLKHKQHQIEELNAVNIRLNKKNDYLTQLLQANFDLANNAFDARKAMIEASYEASKYSAYSNNDMALYDEDS